MRRGEIWWADLPSPSGTEPGFRRSVLIAQIDSFTRSRIATVVVVAITSNVFHANAPGNVRLPKHDGGLRKESVVNVSQVATLDKSFLIERVGRLTQSRMRAVEQRLRLVLGL